MILISAVLVAVALVLLGVGVVISKVMLVYVSIAVSIGAAVLLLTGVLVKRRELFGSAASDQWWDGGNGTVDPGKATVPPPRQGLAELVQASTGAADSGMRALPAGPSGATSDRDVDPEDDMGSMPRIAPGTADRVPPDASVRVVPGRRRYHLAECRKIVGRDAETITYADARDEGFTPCTACLPDTALAARVGRETTRGASAAPVAPTPLRPAARPDAAGRPARPIAVPPPARPGVPPLGGPERGTEEEVSRPAAVVVPPVRPPAPRPLGGGDTPAGEPERRPAPVESSGHEETPGGFGAATPWPTTWPRSRPEAEPSAGSSDAGSNDTETARPSERAAAPSVAPAQVPAENTGQDEVTAARVGPESAEPEPVEERGRVRPASEPSGSDVPRPDTTSTSVLPLVAPWDAARTGVPAADDADTAGADGVAGLVTPDTSETDTVGGVPDDVQPDGVLPGEWPNVADVGSDERLQWPDVAEAASASAAAHGVPEEIPAEHGPGVVPDPVAVDPAVLGAEREAEPISMAEPELATIDEPAGVTESEPAQEHDPADEQGADEQGVLAGSDPAVRPETETAEPEPTDEPESTAVSGFEPMVAPESEPMIDPESVSDPEPTARSEQVSVAEPDPEPGREAVPERDAVVAAGSASEHDPAGESEPVDTSVPGLDESTGREGPSPSAGGRSHDVVHEEGQQPSEEASSAGQSADEPAEEERHTVEAEAMEGVSGATDTSGDDEEPHGGTAVAAAGPTVRVVVETRRYHRSECALVHIASGESDVESLSRAEAKAAGNTPCTACQPDNLPDAGA